MHHQYEAVMRLSFTPVEASIRKPAAQQPSCGEVYSPPSSAFVPSGVTS
jgi:hypothetical protein